MSGPSGYRVLREFDDHMSVGGLRSPFGICAYWERRYRLVDPYASEAVTGNDVREFVHALVEIPGGPVYCMCARRSPLKAPVDGQMQAVRLQLMSQHPGLRIIQLTEVPHLLWARRMVRYLDAGIVPDAGAVWAERYMDIPRLLSVFADEAGECVLQPAYPGTWRCSQVHAAEGTGRAYMNWPCTTQAPDELQALVLRGGMVYDMPDMGAPGGGR